MKPLFVGTCRSRWAMPFSVASIVSAIVVVILGDLVAAIALVIGSALLAPFRRIIVEINAKRLRVDFAAPYWHPLDLRIDQIARASAMEIRPWRHGGWGYRGSLRLFKRLAVILRRGPGIRLDLVGGGWVMITVDDPEAAVAALQTVVRP